MVRCSPVRWPDRLLVCAGFGCFAVALFHAAAIVWPQISEPSPAPRHAVFVGINLLFGVAFVRRARWLPWPFLALTAQQLWSHGGDLLRARAADPPHWDVQSLAVLATLPVLWAVILLARGEATAAGVS